MRTLITCMGEGLIDFLPLQKDAPTTTDFRMHPAGSLLNVAVGLARLHQPTAFACKLSDDFFGRALQAYIHAEHIDTAFLTTTAAANSSLAFVALEAGHASFNFYSEGAADTLLTLSDLPAALFTQTRILHFGSLSLLRGTTPATILATVERLKGQALLSFDLNIRPTLVQDEAGYRALIQRLIALTDILKLSDVDLAWLAPGEPIEQVAQTLLAQGPALVLVTLGARGVLALRHGAPPLYTATFPVDVVDTVGAGDAFCSGFLTGVAERNLTSHQALQLVSEPELQTMLRFACAVAALTCTREGAQPPHYTQVEHFLLNT